MTYSMNKAAARPRGRKQQVCAPVCSMKGFLDLGMGLSLGSCSKDPILEQEGSRVLIFQKSYFLGQLT